MMFKHSILFSKINYVPEASLFNLNLTLKFNFYYNYFTKFFKGFPSIYERRPTIGSYRLPTHRRGAHRKYFRSSLLILESKYWPKETAYIRFER